MPFRNEGHGGKESSGNKARGHADSAQPIGGHRFQEAVETAGIGTGNEHGESGRRVMGERMERWDVRSPSDHARCPSPPGQKRPLSRTSQRALPTRRTLREPGHCPITNPHPELSGPQPSQTPSAQLAGGVGEAMMSGRAGKREPMRPKPDRKSNRPIHRVYLARRAQAPARLALTCLAARSSRQHLSAAGDTRYARTQRQTVHA